MANTITRQVLLNGSRIYVVHFFVTGDGSGEETNTRVNSVTGDMGTDDAILKVMANLSGFSANLIFDATSKVKVLDLASDMNIEMDYQDVGGIVNNAGTGKTGDILITTSGLGSADSGHITLYVKKKA